MLPVELDHVRLTLHLLAAAVWVGGQLTLLGLLPVVRSLGDEAPRQVARRFGLVAWPAYVVLVVTGVWNLFEVDLGARSTEYDATLFAKLGLVALSGIGAAVHAVARTKAALAVWGAVGLLSSLAAVLLGVVLKG